jgi:hypothetical protein
VALSNNLGVEVSITVLLRGRKVPILSLAENIDCFDEFDSERYMVKRSLIG